MNSPRSHITNLSGPILRELMLDTQVPLHDLWNGSLGASSFDCAQDVNRVPRRNGSRETTGDELSWLRCLSRIEVSRNKRELRRVQPKIIKNVGLSGIEDAECTSHNRIFLQRPGESQAWRPIILIELHSAVRDGVGPVRGDHDRPVQVEIAYAPVGWRGDLIAKSQIDRELGTGAKVILHQSGKIPVASRVQAEQEVLFGLTGHAKKKIGQSVAAGGGCQIGGVGASKAEKSPRCGHLIEVPLLATEVHAQFQRVPVANPSHRVCDLKDILENMLRQEL